MTFDADIFIHDYARPEQLNISAYEYTAGIVQAAYDQNRAERAVLLAACEIARDTLADLPEEIDVTDAFNKIEAAIASTW